jgi:hypothetical protein
MQQSGQIGFANAPLWEACSNSRNLMMSTGFSDVQGVSAVNVAPGPHPTAKSWGLAAHALFILQCGNYLFLIGLI